jgi:DNA (cytosine-5)-methyltransferase 1
MKRQPRTLDLFCGIGGLTIGLERAGFKSIGGVDHWEDAATTFEHNLKPLRCFQSDLTETSVADIEKYFDIDASDIDVVVGGPPCQGFSTIGKRDLADPRNQLWKHYFELVEEIRPAYVLIENVEGLWIADEGKFKENIIRAFEGNGYQMECRLIRSADYGVPQLRKRVVFLGCLSGLAPVKFPEATCKKYVTVADAIFDLPKLGPNQAATEYAGPAITRFQKDRRKGCRALSNHQTSNHPPSLIEVLKHIPDGGNRLSIPDRLQPKSGFHNSYARLASDKPAIAVTSTMHKPSSARTTHPTQHRGLTVREGLRLQTFDDNFVVLGARTRQFLQVGNAVPPLLAETFGKAIIDAFAKNSDAAIKRARKANSVLV